MKTKQKRVRKVKGWIVYSPGKNNEVVGVLPFLMEKFYRKMVMDENACMALFESKKWAMEYKKATRSGNYKVVCCTVTYTPSNPTLL